MGRRKTLSEEVVQQGRDLVAVGFSIAETARKLGVPRATLSRALPLPPDVPAASLPTDPLARLVALRDAWITVAEQRTARLNRPDDSVSSNDSIAGGIATQRALDLHERIQRYGDLPEELPADDVQARAVVMTVWYRHARYGSQAAAVKLAAALGIRAAARQPVTISFAEEEKEAEDGDDTSPDAGAPRPAPASAKNSRLH